VLLGSLCSVESLDERVAEFDELGGHRVVFARPVFEHLEQDVALVWAKLYGSGGVDRKEGLPNVRRVDVLHPARQGFACFPAEDHLAVAERNRDVVEALRHRRERT
jgi:hypothetical protein